MVPFNVVGNQVIDADRMEELRRKYKPYIEPGAIFPLGQESQAKIKMDVCELITKIERLTAENKVMAKKYVDSTAVVGCLEIKLKDLKNHLPDNCVEGSCGEEDEITIGDAAAMTINDMTAKYPGALTEDQHIYLVDLIGDYVERAVTGAINSRQKEIGELHEVLEYLLKAQGPLVCGNHEDETHTLGCAGCECDVCNERQDAVLKAEVLSV